MFRVETEVDNDRRDQLRSRLRASNTAASATLRSLRDSSVFEEVPLQVWALGTDGELVGGLDAHTESGWLELDLFWVDEALRGSGVGTRLLAEAERVARERGCAWAKVWTWDFQAPGFYQKRGYEVQCVLEDHPPGVRDFFLTKRLG